MFVSCPLLLFCVLFFVFKPPPSEERPKPVVLDLVLPSTPKDWARYACPDQARQIFRTNSNPHCINTHSITKQARPPASTSHFSQCHRHLPSVVLSLISVLFSTQQGLYLLLMWVYRLSCQKPWLDISVALRSCHLLVIGWFVICVGSIKML